MTRDIVNRLRTNRECLAPCLMDEAADEIVRLEAALLKAFEERDEARRKICEMESECIIDPPCSPKRYALRMGWDCFKENTND